MNAKYGWAAVAIAVGLALGMGMTAAAHGPGGHGGQQGSGMTSGYGGYPQGHGGGAGLMGYQMMPYHHMSPYQGHHMGHGMMMGPGMGPGAMGPDMMGPGTGQGTMMGPGSMGPGMGQEMMMGPGMMGPRIGGALPQDLSGDQVRHMLSHQLAWQQHDGLKLGKVEEVDDDTITAEILGADGAVMRRLEIDRHTGAMHPAQ